MTLRGLHIVLTAVLLGVGALTASAQFKQDAFRQTYADTTLTEYKDTTDKLFSFKEFFGGVGHKHEARIGTLFAGSTVFIGSYQIYNKQYWKLPIVYGGIGTGIAAVDGVIVFALCVVITAIFISFVHAVTARLKIEQIFKYYWTVVSGLALVSLVLAWYGL